jgi:hypothetical protein
MTILEPIIVANYTEQLVYKSRPSHIIDMLILAGYSRNELKYQKEFDAALKDIINQVKYN